MIILILILFDVFIGILRIKFGNIGLISFIIMEYLGYNNNYAMFEIKYYIYIILYFGWNMFKGIFIIFS